MVEIGPFFAPWIGFISLISVGYCFHFLIFLFLEFVPYLKKKNRSFKSEIENECKANKVHAILLMSSRSKEKRVLEEWVINE